jgi:hypothetical protein
MNTMAQFTNYIEQDLPIKLFSWLAYIIIPIIEPMVLFGYSITRMIISIPIYAWKLFWHPNGQSIFDML